MDSILIDNNKHYLAENCIRALTTPAFIPSLIYSIIGGGLTVACYEKFIRKEYFLPYLYFGNTALLYTMAHIFLVIFISEEQENGNLTIGENIDFSHENSLYGSLIISAFGSYFINLACFRLLENWVRSGQEKDTYLSKYAISVLVIILSFIPVIFSVSGDIILINESNTVEASNVLQVEKAMILKLISAIFNLILSLLFIVLLLSYSWSAYINNTIEREIQKEKRLSDVTLVAPLIENQSNKPEKLYSTFQKVVMMLLAIGVLSMLRFIYDIYIIIAIIILGPVWDFYTYIILVVVDGIILIAVAYSSNLVAVKELIIVKRNRQVYNKL